MILHAKFYKVSRDLLFDLSFFGSLNLKPLWYEIVLQRHKLTDGLHQPKESTSLHRVTRRLMVYDFFCCLIALCNSVS